MTATNGRMFVERDESVRPFDVDERSDIEHSDRADALHGKPVTDVARIVRVGVEIVGIDSRDSGEEKLGFRVRTESCQRLAHTTNEPRGGVANRDESSRVVESVEAGAFGFGMR